MSAGRRAVSVTPVGDVGGVQPGDPPLGDVNGNTGPLLPTPAPTTRPTAAAIEKNGIMDGRERES